MPPAADVVMLPFSVMEDAEVSVTAPSTLTFEAFTARAVAFVKLSELRFEACKLAMLLLAFKVTTGLLAPPSEEPSINVFAVIGPSAQCVMVVPANSSSVPLGKLIGP